MKRLLFLTAAVSQLVCAQGELRAQPMDPSARPLRGELRVLPVTGSGSGPSDFCRLGPDGGLVVRVRNIGRIPTSSQTMRVTFHTQPPRIRTAPLPRADGGAGADVTVPILPYASEAEIAASL
jgi:hypothetical protein